MEIVSVTPLRVSSILWQKGPSAWALTILCKATYDLAPGQSPLASEQEPINEADAYWNDDASRSLHAPSDLAPVKLRADVLLVGSAFAPGGAATRSLVARIVVGKVDKSVECVADRVIASDGTVQEGAGFTRMSLLYERAAGGPGTANPVGIRPGARDGYGRITLPNLQPPGTRVSGPGTIVEPTGFGPVAPRWPQRLEKLGRHAGSWPSADWTARPLPGDIDLAYFNVAPLDQQVSGLRDNERIVLENLHHEHARLATALVGVRPCAFVEGRAGAPFRLPMHADTLRIDTDRGVCTLTWRRQLPLERPDEAGRVVVAMESPGQTLSWADVEALIPAIDDKLEIETIPPPAPPIEDRKTSAAIPVPAASSLPFLGGGPAQGAPASRPALTTSRPPQTQTMVFANSGSRSDAALPFQGSMMMPAPASVAPPWGSAAQVVAPPAARELDSLPAPITAAPPAPVSVPLVESAAAVLAQAAAIAPSSPWAAGGSAPSFAKTAAPVALVAPAEAWPRPEPVAIEVRAEPSDVLELLWFDGDSVPRMRRNKAWKPILTALEREPLDRDLDDPALAAEPMEMEDRREVFEILARGSAEDAAGIDRALDAAVRKDGKFVAQLALLAGQIELHFDELETVRATVATAAPFVPQGAPADAAKPPPAGDEALRSAVVAAREFLETADELTPPTVSEAVTTRIREAFAGARRSVPETHLVEQTDRVLLAQRRYRKRIVFGGPQLRCLVHADGAAVPAYLPESLAKKLPMYQRLNVRLIAEVHQQADQYESHHAALRVVALARATPRRARG